ncbi:hypothetical protein CSA_007716, partial [Cucumis sativus]
NDLGRSCSGLGLSHGGLKHPPNNFLFFFFFFVSIVFYSKKSNPCPALFSSFALYSSFSSHTIPFHSHVLPRFLFSLKLPSLLSPHYLRTIHFSQLFRLQTLSLLLQSCNHLPLLKQIHAHLILSSGFDSVSVASKLIRLYANFNDFPSAVSVLNSFPEPQPMLWNSIIKSYFDS